MSPETFFHENEEYYTEQHLDNHPEDWYKVNDGDIQRMYDEIDWKDVMETMGDLYRDFLWDF
jgi:hypothetical protein